MRGVLNAKGVLYLHSLPFSSVSLQYWVSVSSKHAAAEASCFLSPSSRTLTEMQSQGSTSSQPSFDSLSSSDSLLFSDSEQAEDDADVFLTDSSSSVIICGIGRDAAKGDKNLESPGSQWTCDSFTDKEEEEESYPTGAGRKAAHASLESAARQAPKSRGDLLFAQKVRSCGENRRCGR